GSYEEQEKHDRQYGEFLAARCCNGAERTRTQDREPEDETTTHCIIGMMDFRIPGHQDHGGDWNPDREQRKKGFRPDGTDVNLALKKRDAAIWAGRHFGDCQEWATGPRLSQMLRALIARIAAPKMRM